MSPLLQWPLAMLIVVAAFTALTLSGHVLLEQGLGLVGLGGAIAGIVCWTTGTTTLLLPIAIIGLAPYALGLVLLPGIVAAVVIGRLCRGSSATGRAHRSHG